MYTIIIRYFQRLSEMQNKELFDKRLLKLGVKLPYNVYDEKNNLLIGEGTAIDSLTNLHILAGKTLYYVSDKVINQYNHSYDLIQDCYSSLNYLLKHYTEPHFENKLQVIVNKIKTAVTRNREGCIAYVMLDSFPTHSNYSVYHCVHTAILAELMTNHLECDGTLMLASLLMNISIMDFQNDLLQVNHLNQYQKEKIETHSQASVQILKSIDYTKQDVLDLISIHHLTESDNLKQQVLRLCDVFCAKLASRSYRKGLTGDKSIRSLFSEFDTILVNQLIKEIDLIPCGTIVKLNSQETGIVIKKGNKPAYPKVQILLTSNSNYQDNLVIRDTVSESYQIKKILSVEDIKVSISKKKFWTK